MYYLCEEITIFEVLAGVLAFHYMRARKLVLRIYRYMCFLLVFFMTHPFDSSAICVFIKSVCYKYILAQS